jgi:hypothetical protein
LTHEVAIDRPFKRRIGEEMANASINLDRALCTVWRWLLEDFWGALEILIVSCR